MRRFVRQMGRLLVVVVLLAAAAESRAGEVTLYGAHAAYYDEFRAGAIGFNARSTFGNSPISAGFKADYLFRPRRMTWTFEADVQYELPLPWERGIAWVGGGGGILRDDPNGPVRADLDPLASIFVGMGYKKGPLLPYVEVRLTSHETARWVYYVGLRF